MSHYEQRLETDLEHIRGEVSGLATSVKQAVKNSIHALLTANQDLAGATILGDGPINRKMREIDTLCHRFIAVHLPSAGHLRLMSSVIRINIILERIGDYAVTISRELQRIDGAPEKRLAQGIELLANEVQLMLKQAIASFDEDNAELARGTIAMSAQIDNTVAGLYEELLDEQAKWSLTERFAVFSVYHRLERIADQAKNLCEQTIFTVSGQGKASKVYQILFIDDDNSCLSQLAEAVARKHFPEGSQYVSVAGREAAETLSSGLTEFMDSHGMDASKAKPKAYDMTPAELNRFHVIVSLKSPVRTYIEKIPFQTTALNWSLTSVPEECACSDQDYESIHRELSVLIKDMMMLLRGEDEA
jgi:phosphate transport system protein